MMIAVTLKHAFMSGEESVVVPLDADFIQPDKDEIRRACGIELKKQYPLHDLSADYEIDSLDKVVSKIIGLQRLE